MHQGLRPVRTGWLQIAALTTSSDMTVVGAASPDPASTAPPGCGVNIVDHDTVACLLLVGVLNPAQELQKLEKKVSCGEARNTTTDSVCLHTAALPMLLMM